MKVFNVLLKKISHSVRNSLELSANGFFCGIAVLRGLFCIRESNALREMTLVLESFKMQLANQLNGEFIILK